MLFEVNSTTIFHVLRHFDGYSENLLKYLEGEEYYYYDYELKSMQKSVITKSKMKQAIQTIGSKFYHQRIDIFDLMNSIQIELFGSGGRDRTYDQLINSQLLYR
jgi:hypothetical protein